MPTEDKIHFPQPVDTDGNVIVCLDEETEAVSMPLWYWLKIVNYAIWIDGKEYSIHFPQPVDTEGNVIVTLDEETETVSMPLWYWLKIVNYAIWTDGKE